MSRMTAKRNQSDFSLELETLSKKFRSYDNLPKYKQNNPSKPD